MSVQGDTDSDNSKDTVKPTELDLHKMDIKEENTTKNETPNELEASGGARARTFTEEGKENNEALIVASFSSLKKGSEELRQRIANKDQKEQVRIIYSRWMQLYEHFLNQHNRHLSRLKTEDKDEYNKSHDLRDIYLVNVNKEVKDYLAQPEIVSQEQKQQITTEKSVKSGSNQTSISSKRLEAEEKRIELEAKRQALKKKREIEMARTALKMEEEELDIETDIAVTEAKAKVYDQYEQIGEIDKVAVKVELKDPEIKSKPAVTNSTKFDSMLRNTNLDAKATEFVPTQNLDFPWFDYSKLKPQNVHEDKTRMYKQMPMKVTETLPVHADSGPCTSNETEVSSIVKHLRKPNTEVKKFGGNPLDYQKFMRQFHSKVELNCESTDEKMNYLEQLTYGEAYRVVAGYSHLSGERAYEAAIKALKERYGDVEVIASAFIKKALEWPNMKNTDTQLLDEFSLFLVECQNGTESIAAGSVLEYSENIRSLMNKLPFHLHDKWRSIVFRIKENHGTVKFKNFVDFVKNEAKKCNDPTYGNQMMNYRQKERTRGNQGRQNSQGQVNRPIIAHAACETKVVSTQQTVKSCMYCENDTHNLDACRKMMSLNRDERIAYLKGKGCCFGCLKKGHMSNACRRRLICSVCSRQHPTILHNYDSNKVSEGLPHRDNKRSDESDNKTKKDPVNSTVASTHSPTDVLEGAGDVSCAMGIIPVKVKLKNRAKVIDTYAFFDCGSSVSFCTDRLMRDLGAVGRKTNITINTMGSSQTLMTHCVSGLQVLGLSMEYLVDMPNVYTKDEMPVDHEHIPTQREIDVWPHLSGISLDTLDSEAYIGLMIGINVPDAYTPFDIAIGPSGSPHATKTRLGWIPWNILRDRKGYEVNRVSIENIDNDAQLKLLQQSINMDFPEHLIEDKRENSVDDDKFMCQVTNSFRMEEGHCSISLPFRNDNVCFPNNAQQCLQRLNSVKGKFLRNTDFKTDYLEFMSKIIEKGYAEQVPQDQLSRNDGRVWYLPHHGIYHPKKPGKIRVVFDCSAKFMGTSLNQQLLQGPNLANNLLGVLIRFRQENIAVVGDIESMFYQVKVPVEERDYLRFYWWKYGDTETEPVEYRMTVHIFGATSSPGCCNFALQHIAKDFCCQDNLDDSTVLNTMSRNVYVDDCLTSIDTEDKAIELIRDISLVCSKGGFKMTKWMSNNQAVIESVPESDRSANANKVDLNEDSQIERALGVYWFIENDKLGFQISTKDQQPTRRGMLSLVSSVYDPLGIASPFVLVAKIILQKLCRDGLGWDEEIPSKELVSWNKWIEQLKGLEKITIDRCYKPESFEVETCDLHCFADASDKGYGCVFYLRLVDKHKNIHCSFLLGKSRVAPLKTVTIPRMELTAATTLVRLCRIITQEIEYKIDSIFFWTDSMSVLRYIANTKTRFHTFVSNRLAVIREGSDINQWNYIKSSSNPADLASRGANLDKFCMNRQWFTGPEFLWTEETNWPIKDNDLTIPSDDKEVKRQNPACVTTITEKEGMERLLYHFSDWNKLRKVTAWFVKFRRNLWKSSRKEQDKLELRDSNSNSLSVEIMECAERSIITYVQKTHFSDEIESLRNGKGNLKVNSKLRKLDPFIDDQSGLLRVGGRLERADIEYDSKHPIILPGDHVARLIIENIHRRIGHLGMISVMTVLRQKYWILGARRIIKGLVSKCVFCRKYQGKPGNQKMANLPKERLKADDPPFTRVGIDFFGPYELKQGRSIVKGYGVIFTCLNIRAIHLELAYLLDTDSCIGALRRFIARRGVPSFIRTDNGTNFVGSERELREEIQRWNNHQISNFMLQRNIEWEFNPPAASHFGGVWERLIRSVRKVLYSVMQEQKIRLSDEGLNTLFCEVESILNGRPITELSEDISDLNVLTPNHLILQRSGESFPPGLFEKTDCYAKRRWKQIQYLADLFWSRWRKQYLPLLQSRQKWAKKTRNIDVGDIVLLVDNTPRNAWNVGRIVEILPDKNNVNRIAKVKTQYSTLTRPVTKLCLLVENDC